MSKRANEQLQERVDDLAEEKEESFQRIKKAYQEKFKAVMDQLDAEFAAKRIGSEPLRKIREKLAVTEKADRENTRLR